MESLKEKTAKGLFWGGMNNGMQQLIGLVIGIILGRLLTPDDYGMIAMISIFSLIANELQSSGFKTALVNQPHPTHEDYNAVFWFNVMAGAVIYVILFFCAPLIADYYHQPALVPLCRYAFLSFVFSSFGIAQSAYLTKNLKIKEIAATGITAIALSGTVGALMAWQGFSYWSLATQANLFIAINTVLLWYHSSWRPTMDINLRPVRRMFRFSCKIMASAIFTIINASVLNILLGRYFTPRDTGNYNQAYQWNFKCFSVVQGMMNQVAQPVFVELAGQRDRQRAAFRKMLRFTAFISFPLLFGLSLVSQEFIVITIGEKWLDSAHLMQILCLGGAVMPLSTLMTNMVISHGRSNIYMWTTLALGLLQIALMLWLYPYGVRTMVIAYTLLQIVWVAVWWWFVHRLTGYRFLSLLKDTLPFAGIAAAVMVATHFATLPLHSPILLLVSRIVLAALLYFTVMKLAHAVILEECLGFFRRKNHPGPPEENTHPGPPEGRE